MLPSRNLLKPSAGDPIITPTQDMVLGCYFLTQSHDIKKNGHGMIFANISEAINAYRMGYVDLQAKIKGRVDGKILETTVGRMIFNSFLPQELPYINNVVKKGDLSDLIRDSFELCGTDVTAELADNLKRIGFKFATRSGISIAAHDMVVHGDKSKLLNEANEIVKKVNNQYWKGFITDGERYNNTIKVWSQTKTDITKMMITNFKKDRENDIYYMIDSGARGNWGQVTQLCGMKGLVANPGGKTIELPIQSNLKEGFTILEYFIATHGGRKGKSDTALKTAEAGYLTRRLVDAVQDIIIRDEDCGSNKHHIISRKESDMVGVPFETRIFGRTLGETIKDPKTKKVIAEAGVEIDKDLSDLFAESNIQEIKVRSIMTCNTENGICQKCYGRDLGSNKTVEIGTPVGIIAAQSIGEPGTQLTMRTFHMGGVAEGADITQGLTRVEELFEARTPKTPSLLAEISGEVKIIDRSIKGGVRVVIETDGKSTETYNIPPNYEFFVKKGESVNEKHVIAKSKIDRESIKIKNNGIIKEVTSKKVVVSHLPGQEKEYMFSVNDSLKFEQGDYIEMGQALNAGHFNLQQLMKMTDVYSVQKYITNDVQQIYAAQGQSINDKHLEIIVKKMLSKVRIIDAGDSELLPGEIHDIIRYKKVNKLLVDAKKKPAYGEQLLLGLTRVSLMTDSWLAAASFQETIRVLVEAATTKKVDNLRGLKENVIIGKLIQAGEIYKKNFYNKLRKTKDLKNKKAA